MGTARKPAAKKRHFGCIYSPVDDGEQARARVEDHVHSLKGLYQNRDNIKPKRGEKCARADGENLSQA